MALSGFLGDGCNGEDVSAVGQDDVPICSFYWESRGDWLVVCASERVLEEVMGGP